MPENYTTMQDNSTIAYLQNRHPNIIIGDSDLPINNTGENIAMFSAPTYNGWAFRSNGYINNVFSDPNKLVAMNKMYDIRKWEPMEGWARWIEDRANQGDIARMMRTHSKIVVSHTLVGGNVNARTMIVSDLDKILFFEKFLTMHLDWNTYGYTVAEPVFSKENPERVKQLALQRIYKTKPVANEGGYKNNRMMPLGTEPTLRVPYSNAIIPDNYMNGSMDITTNDPFPWVETTTSLPIDNIDDTSNDNIDPNWEWHLVDLLILNPMSIRICRNNVEDVNYLRSKFGNCSNTEWADYVNSYYCDAGNGAYIIAYVQYPFNENGMESILFYPHELIFIPRYASHAYPDGVSQLREAYKEIIQRDVLEEAALACAKRWGDPIMKITLPKEAWQKKDYRDSVLAQLKYSRTVGMDMVVPVDVQVDTVESSGGMDLIGGPIEYWQNKVNKIMQWADSFTESDASNRSLGDVQLSFMEIDAEPERRLFASVFYKCIFLPLCIANGYKESDVPTISFTPINPKDTLEWGNFYSGLIDWFDAGQLNAFFEFIEMPFTNPIKESPREREDRMQEEEDKREAEREAEEARIRAEEERSQYETNRQIESIDIAQSNNENESESIVNNDTINEDIGGDNYMPVEVPTETIGESSPESSTIEEQNIDNMVSNDNIEGLSLNYRYNPRHKYNRRWSEW